MRSLSNVKDHNPGLTLITIKGDQWTFASANADTITKLLSIFLDGLRRRSRWAIAIQDFIVQGTYMYANSASSPPWDGK